MIFAAVAKPMTVSTAEEEKRRKRWPWRVVGVVGTLRKAIVVLAGSFFLGWAVWAETGATAFSWMLRGATAGEQVLVYSSLLLPVLVLSLLLGLEERLGIDPQRIGASSMSWALRAVWSWRSLAVSGWCALSLWLVGNTEIFERVGSRMLAAVLLLVALAPWIWSALGVLRPEVLAQPRPSPRWFYVPTRSSMLAVLVVVITVVLLWALGSLGGSWGISVALSLAKHGLVASVGFGALAVLALLVLPSLLLGVSLFLFGRSGLAASVGGRWCFRRSAGVALSLVLRSYVVLGLVLAVMFLATLLDHFFLAASGDFALILRDTWSLANAVTERYYRLLVLLIGPIQGLYLAPFVLGRAVWLLDGAGTSVPSRKG